MKNVNGTRETDNTFGTCYILFYIFDIYIYNNIIKAIINLLWVVT